MATTNAVRTRPGSGDSVLLDKWVDMQQGGDGAPIVTPDWADKTVEVFGTFGIATISIQGRNDPTAPWTVLTDPFGVALTFSAAGVRVILQGTIYIRPLVNSGDGTTNLQCNILSRRVAPRAH